MKTDPYSNSELPPIDNFGLEEVFLVHWMSYDSNGVLLDGFERDDCKLIGVYSDREEAERAIERAKLLPGFCDYPQMFLIGKHKLNEDSWKEGFCRM